MVCKLNVPAALSTRKDPPYALHRGLGGPQHSLDNLVTERNGLPLGNRTPVTQPVTGLYPNLTAT
jgi:hypothetical protein